MLAIVPSITQVATDCKICAHTVAAALDCDVIAMRSSDIAKESDCEMNIILFFLAMLQSMAKQRMPQ